MPHSTDPKLIVLFATEGDPLRQTVDRGQKMVGNYTSVEYFSDGVRVSVAMDYVSLMGERADLRRSSRELEC